MSTAKYTLLCLGLVGAACADPSPQEEVESTASNLTLPIDVTYPATAVPVLRTASYGSSYRFLGPSSLGGRV